MKDSGPPQSFLLLSSGGGGVAVDVLMSWLERALCERLIKPGVDDPSLQTPLTLLTPYAACLAAEGLHVSGVLAGELAGLRAGGRQVKVCRLRASAPRWKSGESSPNCSTAWCSCCCCCSCSCSCSSGRCSRRSGTSALVACRPGRQAVARTGIAAIEPLVTQAASPGTRAFAQQLIHRYEGKIALREADAATAEAKADRITAARKLRLTGIQTERKCLYRLHAPADMDDETLLLIEEELDECEMLFSAEPLRG